MWTEITVEQFEKMKQPNDFEWQTVFAQYDDDIKCSDNLSDYDFCQTHEHKQIFKNIIDSIGSIYGYTFGGYDPVCIKSNTGDKTVSLCICYYNPLSENNTWGCGEFSLIVSSHPEHTGYGIYTDTIYENLMWLEEIRGPNTEEPFRTFFDDLKSVALLLELGGE